jgi:bifunctional non-homologous end joining protein LigD
MVAKENPMSTVLDRADLFYKEGTSDKVYHTTIEKSGSGYVVNYAYGRRGSALKTGSKTTSPLPESKAREVFQKLVMEKTAKGYQYISKAAGVFSQIPTVSGQVKKPVHQCVLLNAVDEQFAQGLINTNLWVMQPKLDGVRFLLSKSNCIEAFNRKGIPCSCPNEIGDSIQSTDMYYEDGVGTFLIDGELVGDIYHVFDILEKDGEDLRGKPLDQRILFLNELMEDLECDNIVIVPTYFTQAQKKNAFEELKKNNAEGVVFKAYSAAYTPGRPASGGNYLKHKFVETGSFIVSCINNVRSVELKLSNGTIVGNVTIPVNFDVPKVGSVVEVRYLYAYKGGSLYQPVYLGERSDIEESECTEDQLKYKG